MFNQLPLFATPVRLAITCVIPVGSMMPATVTITCDPTSDRYANVYYQDTVRGVMTPEETLSAIDTLVHQALDHIAAMTISDLIPITSEDGRGTLFDV